MVKLKHSWIRTIVITVASDLLQSHEKQSWRKKIKLWMIFFKHMRRNTAWHLITAAVRIQYKQ